MKLQACPRCSAQFDVSSFAKGQKFSCGSCGEVLTAHAPAAPTASPAGRPAVSGRTPGSRAPRGERASPAGRSGKAPKSPRQADAARPAPAQQRGASMSSGRGPQYRPPDRGGEQASAPRRERAGASRRGGAAARRRGGARGERRSASGANPAVLYGAGALVVVAILAFLVFGTGNGGDQGRETAANGAGGGSTSEAPAEPAEPADTIAAIKADLRDTNLRTAADYHRFADRFLALGGAEAESEARKLYKELVETAAPDDAKARAFLGYVDFHGDILGREDVVDPIPDSIAFRDYDFLDAVKEFSRIRWLEDEDEIALAREAAEQMREHERKLLEDHEYRAADRIRANISRDQFFKDYNYETRWAAPYLICYSSNERLSQFDLLQEQNRAERRRLLEEMAERRKLWEQILDEKAAMYTQLYEEFMRRYGERYGLKDLMSPYGGRPDYGPGVRSFDDGVPLVIWIFTDNEAFQEYHSEVKGENIPSGVAGYFSPQTSWVYLYDDPGNVSQRVFEINKNVHEGVHQLEHWFTRQLNKWGEPKFSQDWFGEGIAEYIGSVEMDKARNLEFTGINYPRLRDMVNTSKQLEEAGREYPVFPVEELTKFQSYGQVQQWGSGTWGLPGGVVLGLFYQQAWAFTYFLNEYDDGRYQEGFYRFFHAVLRRETGLNQGQAVFMRSFDIPDPEEFGPMQEAWERFMREDLLKRDPGDYFYKPPAPDDWPEDASVRNVADTDDGGSEAEDG